MTAFLAVLAGVLGLAIGSFLNVVIWRVPRGESVVSPPSSCPGCGAAIRPRDNVPVLGWLLLRGQCRDCEARISARYPLVEAGTAALFVTMALRFGADPVLPAYLYLAAVGVALALIDLDVQRLPDVLTLPSYPVLLVLLVTAAAVDDAWSQLFRALVMGLAWSAAYFSIWFVAPKGMGFGDVKLSGLLGLATGWVGYGAGVVGFFGGFVLGAFISVGLILFRGAGRKTKVPFGPFMLAGALLAVLVGQDLADAYLSVTLG